MIDLEGFAPTADEQRRLRHPSTGGLILFARNYTNPEQLCELVASVRAVRPDILIGVDHEGGRVQRFRDGFTRIPAAASYRAAADGTQLAERAGWLMAIELLACGIDFSFAPVLDVDSGISQIIGDRAFADEAAEASRLAMAFYQGMRRAGMAGVGKHFPGHGGVAADSHLALPVDERAVEAIEARDLVPFRALIDAGIEAIMPAHVIYARCDTSPAGFSRFWIQDVLRARLGFGGVVFSDDLSMAGAEFAGDFVARAEQALTAGCDMVLVCNQPGETEPVLEAVAELPPRPQSVERLQRMCRRTTVDRAELLRTAEWRETADLICQFGGRAS
ncbi:MAG: beta-N-acetylhexosaminidase [Methylotetracoccus sp.]